MERKIINVESLVPNIVLSEDIYNYNTNVVLYKKGTVLTEEKINKLKRFGNISIYVDTNLEIEKTDKIVRRKIETDLNKIYSYADSIIMKAMSKHNLKEVLSKFETNIYDHSYKVALLSVVLALNIESIDEYQLEQLVLAALLHDVGKSTIDFSILNKPGRLTDEEYEIIKTHSQNGYDILSSSKLFSQNICEAVLSHHENEDGTGYPNNIKKDEIPLFSKIIHICDVYSALTSKRCYKDAWTYEEALNELNKNITKYDREILEILKIILPYYMRDDVVLLSTNQLATIININSNGILVQVFGNNDYIRIENKSSIYVKKKIITR